MKSKSNSIKALRKIQNALYYIHKQGDINTIDTWWLQEPFACSRDQLNHDTSHNNTILHIIAVNNINVENSANVDTVLTGGHQLPFISQQHQPVWLNYEICYIIIMKCNFCAFNGTFIYLIHHEITGNQVTPGHDLFIPQNPHISNYI